MIIFILFYWADSKRWDVVTLSRSVPNKIWSVCQPHSVSLCKYFKHVGSLPGHLIYKLPLCDSQSVSCISENPTQLKIWACDMKISSSGQKATRSSAGFRSLSALTGDICNPNIRNNLCVLLSCRDKVAVCVHLSPEQTFFFSAFTSCVPPVTCLVVAVKRSVCWNAGGAAMPEESARQFCSSFSLRVGFSFLLNCLWLHRNKMSGLKDPRHCGESVSCNVI